MAVATPTNNPESEGTFSMRSSHTLDAIGVTFDDGHLVADAGLVQTATLAQHLGLRALFNDHVELGDAAGHANVWARRVRVRFRERDALGGAR